MQERKFSKECRVFKHPEIYKDVIDLFIFKNPNALHGEGKYSMYIASTNGILLYEGIDKKDSSSIVVQPISNDFIGTTLSLEALDCNSKGQIVFDLKSQENKHGIKCYLKTKNEEKYDYPLDGPKKMVKFFGNYIIEVKTEKGMDKL